MPGESVTIALPDQFKDAEVVAVMRRKDLKADWFEDAVVPVTNNRINLVNVSSKNVKIKKSQHIADIRRCTMLDVKGKVSIQRLSQGFNIPVEVIKQKRDNKDPSVKRIYDINRKDFEQYNKFEPVYYQQVNYRDKMEIDPDNQLSPKDRKTFQDICLEYQDVFKNKSRCTEVDRS